MFEISRVDYGTVFLRLLDGVFSFQNNCKNLDPCYRMDLDHWDCLGRVKLTAKLHRMDLVICSHSRQGKPRLIAE